jgi:hypothetical protein
VNFPLWIGIGIWFLFLRLQEGYQVLVCGMQKVRRKGRRGCGAANLRSISTQYGGGVISIFDHRITFECRVGWLFGTMLTMDLDLEVKVLFQSWRLAGMILRVD